jgi:hypothetical protein
MHGAGIGVPGSAAPGDTAPAPVSLGVPTELSTEGIWTVPTGLS